MRSTTGGITNMQNLQKSIKPFQNRKQLAIILVLSSFLHHHCQTACNIIGPVSAALITLPVALTGLYFGTNAGLIAGFCGIILNVVLFPLLEGNSWLTWS